MFLNRELTSSRSMSAPFHCCTQGQAKEPMLPSLFVRVEMCPGCTSSTTCSTMYLPAPDSSADFAEEPVSWRLRAGELPADYGLARFCRPRSEAVSILIA